MFFDDHNEAEVRSVCVCVFNHINGIVERNYRVQIEWFIFFPHCFWHEKYMYTHTQCLCMNAGGYLWQRDEMMMKEKFFFVLLYNTRNWKKTRCYESHHHHHLSNSNWIVRYNFFLFSFLANVLPSIFCVYSYYFFLIKNTIIQVVAIYYWIHILKLD